jgi:hypothetical protein
LSLSTQVLSLGLASSSANGALSSTDWSTFNGKQNTITLTTTGTSGAATLVGATLNIPQYADQFVGTVTSVAALTLGTTGTDLSSTVANGTTTPVITLNVPTASATNRGALSSTDWTTFNNKQAALNGTGFVKISGTTISYDNSTYYLASNPSAYIALTALTASSPLSYNNTTGAFTIAQASGSVNGFLSSTDWTTFNNKQNTITNPVTGTGTTNYLPKWTSGSAIGDSVIQESSSLIGVNVTPTRVLHLSSSGTSSAIRLDNTVSGRPFLLTYDDSQNLTFINSSDSGYTAFNSGTGASTTKMLLTNAGNLGLGVTPSAWTDFKVFQNVGGSLIGEVGQLDLWQNAYYDGTSKYYANGTATRYSMLNGTHRWFYAASGTANGAISFTQAMTLDASGNLMVGGTSVYGATITSYASATRSGGIGIRNSAGTFAGFFGTYAAGSGSGSTDILAESAGFMAFTSGGSERLRITSGGNVGIGTTSPNNLLTLYSASSAIYTQWVQSGTGTSSTDGLRIGLDASSNGIINLNEGTALITSIDGTECMRITLGGNVGVNCTATNAKLEVVATSGEVFRADAASGAYRIVATQTGVNMNGNVGIGTTSPGSKLSIVGLPTSATGLSAGDIWNDGGTLKIV